MTTSIIQAQLTAAGLLIPRAALSGWQDKDIEVVRDGRRIIIQPKSGAAHERERVLSVLETAGLLLPKDTLLSNHRPVTPDERAELGCKCQSCFVGAGAKRVGTRRTPSLSVSA
jgi:hypothetical protein